MFLGVGVGVSAGGMPGMGGGVKRKIENDMMSHSSDETRQGPKKPRLVFTDIQRRTLHAIFKETKRPSKEMQQTIAQQLGLEVTYRSILKYFYINEELQIIRVMLLTCTI